MVTELGEVLNGDRPGRRTSDELTIYKGVGHAVEDLAVGWQLVTRAQQEGLGTVISW